MFILFLSVSFVSFRRCKVTAISGSFQEISSILLKVVWTNFFDSSQSCMDNRLIFGQIAEIHPKLVQNERGDRLRWHSPGLSQRLFGTEMKLVRVGGGMETSNFAVSYPSMQIFTFGPNVYDAHTINEHVEISSIEHTWKYMLELLKKI